MKGELKEAVERAARLAAGIRRNAEEHFKADLPPVYETMVGDAAAVETIIAALSQPEGPPAIGVEEVARPNFAWLIEAPGARYLGAQEISHYPAFFWTTDHNKATRFISREQADAVMMAVRRMEPSLFAFAANLGDPWPVEHGWLAALSPQPVPARGEEGVG